MTSSQSTESQGNAEDESSRGFTSLYFAYSSNLSPRTMKQRCPDSLYVGLARLDGYKWIISSMGFANIISSPEDVVYGNLYFISGRDESALDVSEGVPWWSEKHHVPVTRFTSTTDREGQKVDALAYIDVQRKDEGTIERDYGIWINRAIEDGLQSGVPSEYVDKYMRPAMAESKSMIGDIEMVRTRLGSLADDARKLFASGKFHPGSSGGI